MDGVLLLVVTSLVGAPPPDLHTSEVNLLIGDEALVEHFDGPPPATLSGDERTRIHLSYVLRRLRARSDAHLSPRLRVARGRNLDQLEAYITAGRFPHNDGHPDAFRPTFVDDRGAVCAVGHLFAETNGLRAAHRIAGRFKYAFVSQIDDPELLSWAATSGLTLEELALIQPAYPPEDLGQPAAMPTSTLDRADGETHVTIGTGFEIGGPPGVTTAHELYVQGFFSTEQGSGASGIGLGAYASAGFAVPIDHEQDASVAASNVEVGGLFVIEEATWGRLVLRGGGLVPSAPTSDDTVPVGARAITGRLTDTALRLPAAAGGRASVSPVVVTECEWLHFLGQPAYCVLRFDGGVDVLSSDGGPVQAIPRLNAAVGAQFQGGGLYLESATIFVDAPGADARFSSTLAATLRYRLAPDLGGVEDWTWLEGGVSAVVPVTDEPAGWALTFDVRATFGPSTEFEGW